MCTPPLTIPSNGIACGGSHGGPCDRVIDTETPLASDDGNISAAVIVTRVGHIRIAVGGNTGPFDVVMIVVEGKVLVGEVGIGITGTPLVVHHLNVDEVGSRSAESRLHSADATESGVVVSLDEGRRRWPIGFVDKLDGTGAPEVGVGVDDIGNPFEELVGTLVIVVVVKSGRWCILARESFMGLLSARCTVQIDNYIETCGLGPPADTLEVCETTLGEVFAAVHNGFHHPISDGDTDGVQSKTLDLGDIALDDPFLPMILENSIGSGLSKLQDTVELRLFVTAAHSVPLVAHHPRLDDEETTQVDSTDFVGCWEPCVGHAGQKRPTNKA